MKIISRLSGLGLIALLMISGSVWAQDEDHVSQLADDWIAAYNLHDEEGLAGLYSDDAVLMMHGGPVIRGREAIGAFWAQDFLEGNPITVLNVTHSVDGVDMVLVHGNYQVIDRDNGLTLGAGRFAHIWLMNNDGDWELDRDLWHQPFEPY